MTTTQRKLSLRLLMLVALSVAPACGDDSSGNAEPPDLNGGSNGESTGGDQSGGTNEAGTTGGTTGETTTGGTNDGGTQGEDCAAAPTTSAEILNGCPPEGVERRAFDNAERINGYTQPLPDLPT